MKKPVKAVLWAILVCLVILGADWTGLSQRLPIEKSAIFGLVVALFASGVIRDAAENRVHKGWIQFGGIAATFIGSTLLLNVYFERQMRGIEPPAAEWMALDRGTGEPTRVTLMGLSLPTDEGRLIGSLGMQVDPENPDAIAVTVSSGGDRDRVLARIESASITALGLFNSAQIRGIDDTGQKTPSGDLQEVELASDLSLTAGCRAGLPPPYEAYALETIRYAGNRNQIRVIRVHGNLATGCGEDLGGTFPTQDSCDDTDAEARSCYVCERNIRNKEFVICEDRNDEGSILIGVLAHNHQVDKPWARFAAARLAIEAKFAINAESEQDSTPRPR